ncbi:MAG: putative hydrolase or acyltransferase of alpha/beta superfamily [Methanobacterium sp. Maddingley MBC34]|nr:MAG: putative hydrolase or acyltransferase of alpha/beta superfamily [Methanobacterium sp. Maddingley MBC34]
MDLFIKESGQENPETIIFLHGGGLAGWIWDEQVKTFQDYHCLIPDLPEHGQSAETKPFTIASAAEMVVDLIQTRTRNGKAHLVGLSLGAQIIVQILATHPEVVDHALINGTLIHGIPHQDVLLKLLNYTFKVYEPVKDTDFFIKANMRTYNISKSYFHKFKESTLQIKADSLDRILHENLFFKLPSGLEKANVPVLVMMGEKDYKVIKESARDLVKVLPNSSAYIVPGLGHVWNMESPELFNRVLRSWITGKPLPNTLWGLKF